MIQLRSDTMWCDDGTPWTEEETLATKFLIGAGKGGGTSTIKQDIPQWLSQSGHENYAHAVEVSGRPFQQAPNGVAGWSPLNQTVQDRAVGMQGQADALYGEARGLTQDAIGGYVPQQVGTGFAARGIDGGAVAGNGAAIQGAINPYVQNVEAYGLQALDQQRRTALNDVADSAFSTGSAFGSRHAVREAATNAQAAQKAGELSAGLRAQAYDSATSLLSSDAQRAMQAGTANAANDLEAQRLRLTAEQANQTAGQNDVRLRLGGAAQLAEIADKQGQGTVREIGALDQAAQQRRVYDQSLVDQDVNRFNSAYNYPIEMLNLRQSSLGLSPFSTQQTSQTSGGGSVGGQAAGGALLGASVSGGSPWGALIGAGIGAATSDPDTKRDIERVGTDAPTGLGIFSYAYKGDAASAPKRMGLMADDVKEKVPAAYTEHGGVGGILFDRLPEHLRDLAPGAAPEPAPKKRAKKGRG